MKNERQELISVVVPVYNVSEYLRRCLDSIIGQSYKTIEIIVVDDGSTDSSRDICDEYAKLDSRIKVYHKENGGLSDARNYGVNKSHGEYITFVDSDDFIDEKYVEILYKVLIECNADMSVCEARRIYEDHIATYIREVDCIKLSREKALEYVLHEKWHHNAYARLYPKYVLEKVPFPKGLIYEDLAVCFDIIMELNTVAFTGESLYNYVIRKDSIMTSDFNPKQLSEEKIIDGAMNRVVDRYPNLKGAVCFRRLHSYYIVLRRIYESNYERIHTDTIRRIRRKSLKYFWKTLLERDIVRKKKLEALSCLFGYKTGVYIYSTYGKICKLIRKEEWGKKKKEHYEIIEK